VDIRGANSFKEFLLDLESKIARSRRSSLADVALSRISSQQKLLPASTPTESPVESILVCTGVYNPQNDLLFHLQNLFKTQTIFDLNNNIMTNSDQMSDSNYPSRQSSIRSQRSLRDENQGETNMEQKDLHHALSRKNSFISYFDNALNIPDLTFDNLLVAVEYIVRKVKK
jgi:hypothetical protein